jgi:hypothetical protein
MTGQTSLRNSQGDEGTEGDGPHVVPVPKNGAVRVLEGTDGTAPLGASPVPTLHLEFYIEGIRPIEKSPVAE